MQIGNTMAAAKVNSKLVQPGYELQNAGGQAGALNFGRIDELGVRQGARQGVLVGLRSQVCLRSRHPEETLSPPRRRGSRGCHSEQGGARIFARELVTALCCALVPGSAQMQCRRCPAQCAPSGPPSARPS